ncbi:hypothetical protein ACFL67_03615 [candidate division KSB1 bacterium]
MGVPTGEFRTTDISLTEPSDRTLDGTVVNTANPLDFGTVNNTGGSVQAGPKVLWWQCTDLAGNTTLSNLKFWLSSNSDLAGTNDYYLDISDTWTQNKTVSQTSSGNPGHAPRSLPAANISCISGGNITGTGHADTSQYIYLALSIGRDEAIGNKGGADGGFKFSLKFDYA